MVTYIVRVSERIVKKGKGIRIKSSKILSHRVWRTFSIDKDFQGVSRKNFQCDFKWLHQLNGDIDEDRLMEIHPDRHYTGYVVRELEDLYVGGKVIFRSIFGFTTSDVTPLTPSVILVIEEPEEYRSGRHEEFVGGTPDPEDLVTNKLFVTTFDIH